MTVGHTHIPGRITLSLSVQQDRIGAQLYDNSYPFVHFPVKNVYIPSYLFKHQVLLKDFLIYCLSTYRTNQDKQVADAARGLEGQQRRCLLPQCLSLRLSPLLRLAVLNSPTLSPSLRNAGVLMQGSYPR